MPVDPQVNQNNPSAVANYNLAVAYEAEFFTLLTQGNGELNTAQKVRAAIQLYYISGATTKATDLSGLAVAAAQSNGMIDEPLQTIMTALTDVVAAVAAAAAPPTPAPSPDPASGGAVAVSVAQVAVQNAQDALAMAMNALIQASADMNALQGG